MALPRAVDGTCEPIGPDKGFASGLFESGMERFNRAFQEAFLDDNEDSIETGRFEPGDDSRGSGITPCWGWGLKSPISFLATKYPQSVQPVVAQYKSVADFRDVRV